MDQDTPPKKSGFIWKLIFYLIVLPVGLFTLYTWATLNFVYASGERAGYLQKFSKKGWLFKTWEGELVMINLPGAAPEKFNFSVRSDDIAQKIADHLGQRVSLVYDQRKGIPVSWFGETEYFITEVKPVLDINQAVPNTGH